MSRQTRLNINSHLCWINLAIVFTMVLSLLPVSVALPGLLPDLGPAQAEAAPFAPEHNLDAGVVYVYFDPDTQTMLDDHIVGNDSCFPSYSPPQPLLKGPQLCEDGVENTATVSEAWADLDGPNEPAIPQIALPEKSDEAEIQILNTTGLPMAWFEATVQPNSVSIGWESVNESNIVGYSIQRAADFGEIETVNSGLIAAINAGTLDGHIYTFEDTGVTNGGYRYRLVIFRADGGIEHYGRSTVLVLGQRLFTPLVFD